MRPPIGRFGYPGASFQASSGPEHLDQIVENEATDGCGGALTVVGFDQVIGGSNEVDAAMYESVGCRRARPR